jgi:hypothetical protein
MDTRAPLVLLPILVGGIIAACGASEGTPDDRGTEGKPCFPNASCNPGLTCLSNVCVKSGAGGSGGAGGAAGVGGAGGGAGSAGADASAGSGGTAGAGGSGGSAGSAGTGGTAGAGGSGGGAGSSETGGTAGAGGSGGGAGSSGTGGTAGSAGSSGGRLLLTEVVASPSEAEYVAIRNTGSTSVGLTHYFLADFDTYYLVADTTPSPPVAADFLVQFPAGSSIGPGETQYVSITGAECFKTACGNASIFAGFGVYPTYEIASGETAKSSASVPDMIVPFAGSVGPTRMLTNTGEPVILFYWDGVTALVTDIDYVRYGTTSGTNPGVNKTGVTVKGSTYVPDTADSPALWAPLGTGPQGTTTTCRSNMVEIGEIATGGNGLGGHDETSEPNATNWIACTIPSAGK